MKGDNVAMVINGDQGTISRIDVLDSDIPADTGVKIGTPFSDLYSKAFGNCQRPTVMIIVPSNVKPKAVNILATSSAGNGVVLKG